MAIEILSEGTCEVTLAPMSAHGLEGYVKGDKIRFQKCKGPNGSEWFRVYPSYGEYYETAGERVFFAYFKILADWNPEANEISTEDLEAAADLHDRLVDGAA